MTESTHVTIPRAVAVDLARWHRQYVENASPFEPLAKGAINDLHTDWADLLDPPPPSLRERVAKAARRYVADHDLDRGDRGADWLPLADAILAVIADDIESQPHSVNCGTASTGDGCYVQQQRAADLARLRGDS
jgi:hypothetical protein